MQGKVAVLLEHFCLRKTEYAIFSNPDLQIRIGAGEIGAIARQDCARAGDVCFCVIDPGKAVWTHSKGATVICDVATATWLVAHGVEAATVIVDDPKAVFLDFLREAVTQDVIEQSNLLPAPGISPKAKISPRVHIEAGARVDDDVEIRSGAIIHSGVWLKRGCLIKENAVIGTDGINAYRGADGVLRSFPHIASVIIGENANVGAGCTIVRGILGSTRIGAETIIGSLSSVGHGTVIGDGVWMSAGALIGGHCDIGNYATLGLGVTLRDNIRVGARANAGMGSVLTKNVTSGISVFGNPARKMLCPLKTGPAREARDKKGSLP